MPPPAVPRQHIVRKKGVDPVLSEEMILDCLSVDCTLDGIQALQTGALFSIVDAYDRLTVRDAYLPIVYASLALHATMSRIHALTMVKRLLDKGELTDEKLDAALEGLYSYATGAKIDLKRMVSHVAECAKSSNPIS